MADDIARLGLAIDSAPAAKASQELDKLVNSSKRAEAANDDLASAAEAAGRGIDQITRETKGARAALEQAATAARSVEAAAVALGRNAIAPTVAYVRAIEQVNNALRIQQQINRSAGVRSAGDAAGRAADIAAYGDALDDLRAKFNPLFAAERQHRQTIEEIAEAARVGAISEKERADAITRTTGVYEAQVGQIRRLEGALRNQAAAAKTAAQAAVSRQTIMPDRGADVAAYGAELDRLRAKYNPLFAAGQQYRQTLQEINEAAKIGAISERERAVAVDRTKTAFATQVVQLNQVAKASGLAGHQMMNLSRQMNDVVTMGLMGASPFQIFTSQAGQIYQILQEGQGGVTGSLKYLGERLAAIATPARIATAGLAGLGIAAAVAYGSFASGQKILDDAIHGAGASTGLSIRQLEDYSEAAAASGRISTSSAREIIAAFASTGKIGESVYSGLVDVTRNYAALTQQEVGPAAAQLAAALADPAKGVIDLDQKLNFLDTTTRDYIRTLANTGQRTKAQEVAMKAISDALPEATRRVTLLGRAWYSVAGFADMAWTGMGKAVNSLIDGPTLDLQIAKLEKQLADARANPRAAITSGPHRRSGSDQEEKRIQEELNKLYAERAKLAADIATKGDQAATKRAEDALRASDPRVGQMEELVKLQADYQRELDKAGKAGNAESVKKWSEALSGVNNQLSTMLDNDTMVRDANGNLTGKLASAAEQYREELRLELAVSSATTAEGKRSAEAARAAYQAKKAGANDAEVAARKEGAMLQAQAELYTQLTQAARERLRVANEQVSSIDVEIAALGKTGGEAAELRANYQALADLSREAAMNGTKFDDAQYEAIKRVNAGLRDRTDLLSRLKIQSDIVFDRGQLGRTEGDQQIASSLRSAGLPVDLSSYEAGLMRVNAELKDLKDTSSSALSGFASDLMNGTKAAEALANQLKNIANKLIQMATDQLVSQAFGGLLGGDSGSGLLGGLLGVGPSGTVGATTGAVYVAGMHDGGIVGRDRSFSREIPALTFLGAPKFHSGGGFFRSDERPAVLQIGEEVLTRDDPRHVLNGGRIAKPNVGDIGGRITAMSQSVTLSPQYNISAPGGMQLTEAGLRSILDENNKSLLKMVPQAAEKARTRMPRAYRT